MKKFALAAIALAASTSFAQAGQIVIVQAFGMPGINGSVDVDESIDDRGRGVYDVANNSNGFLRGIGVSNVDTSPVTYNNDGSIDSGIGCDSADEGGNFFCYRPRALTASNWDTEVAYTDEFTGDTSTFEDIFGSFSSVAGTDTVFNWFDGADGELADGKSVSDFFGFLGTNVASNIIGSSSNNNGTAFFTAGMATVGNPNVVPLPAAGFLLIAGLGGLATLRKKKQA